MLIFVPGEREQPRSERGRKELSDENPAEPRWSDSFIPLWFFSRRVRPPRVHLGPSRGWRAATMAGGARLVRPPSHRRKSIEQLGILMKLQS